jgi:hypothetical protein
VYQAHNVANRLQGIYYFTTSVLTFAKVHLVYQAHNVTYRLQEIQGKVMMAKDDLGKHDLNSEKVLFSMIFIAHLLYRGKDDLGKHDLNSEKSS